MIAERPQLLARRRNGEPGAWSVRVMDADRITVALVYGRTEDEARWLADTAMDAWSERLR